MKRNRYRPAAKPARQPSDRPGQSAAPRNAGRIPEFVRSRETRPWLLGFVLIGVTVLAYWPALHGGFLWDDDTHISANPTLLSPRGLWDIWFKLGATCQYYPLTFTVFWVGHHLWGLNTLGYHLVNVVMHGLVAVLLWQVLARLRVRGAGLAGAIFALHPVCVMSAAWMTEIKNTLSGALALGSAWAYVRFAGLGVYEGDGGRGDGRGGRPLRGRGAVGRHEGDGRPGAVWRWYGLALGLFGLGLLAKTAVSFLPVTLLLVTWWQRERLRWRDVWPLLPMVSLAVAIGQVTFYVESHSGASGEPFKMGWLERVIISGHSFWFYLGKVFVPHRLTFIYERWRSDAGAAWQYLYPAATVAVLGGCWALRRRIGKGPFVALAHFYISTSLLILLVVLYMTRYSFVSDHWQYFGCMGVIALAAAGLTRALDGVRRRSRFIATAASAGLLLILAVRTWHQSLIYRNPEGLWRDTLSQNPDCWMAYNNLGILLEQQGKPEQALVCYRESLRLKPDNADALTNLGKVLALGGQVDQAIECYAQALRIMPDSATTYFNLGLARDRQGRLDEAAECYRNAIRFAPDYVDALNGMGVVLAKKGQIDDAISCFEKALELRPDNTPAHINLGQSLQQQNKLDAAIWHYNQALRSAPENASAHAKLGVALEAQGRLDEAAAHLRQSLNSLPNYADLHFHLGCVLARLGRRDEAIAQLRAALGLKPDYREASEQLEALGAPGNSLTK